MNNKVTKFVADNRRQLAWLVLVAAGLAWLMLYRLGNLTGGLSASEVTAATAPVGWHGIYRQPLYLPLEIIRSVVFVIYPNHGQALTRLPNTILGALAIVAFVWLIKIWHSSRTALLTGLLFATGAWTLHVSRLASFDVVYLWATPTMLLVNSLLQRNRKNMAVPYVCLCIWGLMLYVPGMVWLIAASAYLQRSSLKRAWQGFEPRQRLLYVLLGFVWLPLLLIDLLRTGNFVTWLGLPSHWASLPVLGKHLVGVPLHLFVRGPEYSYLWLGRAPLLDVFTLVVCLLGIYFYATHLSAGRSRQLLAWAVTGTLLVGVDGPVGLSILVPLLYVGVAAGIAYLLHEWMGTFPNNPLARGLGLGLIALAVGLSCLYNMRAYFVAWPHNPATGSVFKYHR